MLNVIPIQGRSKMTLHEAIKIILEETGSELTVFCKVKLTPFGAEL